MIIRDVDILELLNREIEENNRIYSLNIPLVKRLDQDYPDTCLEMLKDFIISFSAERASAGRIDRFMEKMKPVMMRMTNLDNFAVMILPDEGRRSRQQDNIKPVPISNSYIPKLPSSLSTLYFENVDINDIEPEDMSHFESLSEFQARNCGLRHPDILKTFSSSLSETDITLTGLDFSEGNQRMNEALSEFIISRGDSSSSENTGRFRTDNDSLNSLSRLVRESRKHQKASDGQKKPMTFKMSFREFVSNMDCISQMFSNRSGIQNTPESFRIRVEVRDSGSEEDMKILMKTFSEKKEMLSRFQKGGSNPEIYFSGDLEPMKQIISCHIPSKCFINVDRIGDLSIGYLARNKKNIKGIRVLNENAALERNKTYSLSDFVRIKSAVETIKKECLPLPERISRGSSGLSEKEIFTRIYFELAKDIDYNHDLAEKEIKGIQENDGVYTRTKEGIRSRNLAGGLIDGKSVCSGDADILRCVCREVGIDCDWLCGYNGNLGHAWNRVKLDGQHYLCDLTWDRDDIRNGIFPLDNFLKSSSDFGHENVKSDRNYSDSDIDCSRSISEKERIELFNAAGQHRCISKSSYLHVQSHNELAEDDRGL